MNLKNLVLLILWFFLAANCCLHAGTTIPADQRPFFDDFNSIDPAVWTKQDYTWPDAASYDRPSQVTTQNSILTILVKPTASPIQGKTILSGGLMSHRVFLYGRFSAKMKNQLVPGLDNCFF